MINKDSYCLLCGRMLEKPFDKHHIIPKSRGGRETIYLHKICHSKIHSSINEVELKKVYNSIEKLKEHPEIYKFR